MKAKRKAIAERKQIALVDFLAARTREAFNEGRIPTLLAYEAVHRNTIRSILCLRGHSWSVADLMAANVVAEVLRKLVAKRPSWNEGQPEWTIEGGTLIERTRCVRCHKALQGDQLKFCSDACRTTHHGHLFRMREADENQMAKMASTTNF